MFLSRAFGLILALSSCAGSSGAPIATPAAQAAWLASQPVPDRLDARVLPVLYEVYWRLDPVQAFEGEVRITLQLAAPTRAIWLHAKDLDVRRATA